MPPGFSKPPQPPFHRGAFAATESKLPVARDAAGGGEHATPGMQSGDNQARFLGQSFETGPQRDLWSASASSALISGRSFEKLEALIWGPLDFVPKLTLFETGNTAPG